MSADRWSECPKCQKKKVAAVAEVRSIYGLIPLEEFERRLKAANIAGDEETESTMREDWELYIDGGKLKLSYAAGCKCGFSFSVKQDWKME